MNDLNILQINIRGMISKETQDRKCPALNHIMAIKQIDIVLIQEWCATKREEVAKVGTNSVSDDQNQTQHKPKFPLKFFPNYNVHFHSTECSPIPQ